MALHNPPHPSVLPELGLSVTAFAKHLGFARETLSRVMNGYAAVSTDLAIRLEMAGISTARLWLSIQADYDLWVAQQREQPVIERLYHVA